MRLVATITVLGSFLYLGSLKAQSLAEHGAAAAGATIGTAAGKPMSGAINKVFGDVTTPPKATPAAKTTPAATAEKPSPAGAPEAGAPAAAMGSAAAGDVPVGSGSAGASAGRSKTDELVGSTLARRRSASSSRRHESATRLPEATLPPPVTPPAAVTPPAPKEPTAAEVASIQVGATERDVLAALGVPASRVTIPDDDGHLRESYQYWANGSQVGTVRLDNGYVVKVEARPY